NAAILKRLLDAGADVKSADASGDTLLMAAVRAGNVDAVDLLLERGAAVNAGDPQFGHTALMWAARRNDTAIMKRLLARGAPADENGVDRQAALDVITALIDAGVDVNARVKEFPPARRYLLPLASLEWVDFTGQTPFIRAAQAGDVPVMTLLLSKGADPK